MASIAAATVNRMASAMMRKTNTSSRKERQQFADPQQVAVATVRAAALAAWIASAASAPKPAATATLSLLVASPTLPAEKLPAGAATTSAPAAA
eukprot:scaffold180571_cov37-Tisochrysis_lutea.AAC.2